MYCNLLQETSYNYCNTDTLVKVNYFCFCRKIFICRKLHGHRIMHKARYILVMFPFSAE